MRIEQIIHKALEQTNDDRYKLSVLVFMRVKELSNGYSPLVPCTDKDSKELSDIALREIAEGKITLAERVF